MKKASNHQKADPLYSALVKIATKFSNRQYEKLINEIDDLAKKYIMDGVIGDNLDNKDQMRAYHNWRHFIEMDLDAMLARPTAEHLFLTDAKTSELDEANQKALELYLKLLQCMHAAHDIVQTSGPIKNEQESAQRFKDDFAEIMGACTEDQPEEQIELNTINLMAERVIVDGTCFMYGDKKTPAVKNYMSQTQDDSPLMTLGALSASFNDTSRMIRLNEMLLSEVHRAALLKQYMALKDNPLCMLFLTLPDNSPSTLKGSDLYKDVRTRLKKVTHNHPDEIDNLPQSKRLPLLVFMQIFGQNLRVNCELSDKTSDQTIRIIFSSFIRDKDVSDEEDSSPLKSLKIELADPSLVERAYNFIMTKMNSELDEKGFCVGMKKSIENQNTGFEALNEKFKDENGIELIAQPYTKAWSEYVANANAVLAIIKQQEDSQDPNDLIEFKRQFVISCLEIARNQSGLFMGSQLKLGIKSPPSPKTSWRKKMLQDIKRASS